MPRHTVVYDFQTFTLQRFGGISRYVCEVASRVNRTSGFGAKIVAPIHFNDYLSASDVPSVGLNLHLSHPRLEPLNRAVCRVLSPWPIRCTKPALVHRTFYQPTYVPSSAFCVVTAHDMIHELFPQMFSTTDPTSRNKRESVRRADLVLCNSRSTANDLVQLFNVSWTKVRITYLGLTDTFARTRPSSIAPHPRPYLLFVGHRGGYKNFAGAIKAYARSVRLREAFDFVVFGGFGMRREEQDLVASLGIKRESVRRLVGSDEELANAYRHARAFVYPSRYEGFGIPPLEAMASGCPVACSNVSSIPEVVGSAAEMFDPDDTEQIITAVERVCFDDTRRRELIKAGFERLQQFSWDRCASDTVLAYRSLLGSAAA